MAWLFSQHLSATVTDKSAAELQEVQCCDFEAFELGSVFLTESSSCEAPEKVWYYLQQEAVGFDTELPTFLPTRPKQPPSKPAKIRVSVVVHPPAVVELTKSYFCGFPYQRKQSFSIVTV